MARRKQSRAAAPAELDDDYADWRYRRLGSFLLASELGSPAAAFADEIAAERTRLDGARKPIADRLARLERFVAGLGLARQAERFMAARLDDRRRDAPPSDFVHRIPAT